MRDDAGMNVAISRIGVAFGVEQRAHWTLFNAKRLSAKARGLAFALEFGHSGIDRVDNTRGYEPDNAVSCCGPCNTSKGNRPVADLVARARRIVERAQ